MKLEDIIALAKQGYKPSDIKELISLAEEDQKEDQKEDSKGTENSEEAGVGEPEDKKPESAPGEDPKSEDIDYKKLYEDSQKELQKLQQENVNKNNADSDPVKDGLEDIIRGFM